jgi:hypothetical protein
MGKNTLGGLARKFLAGAAPGLTPMGATCLNSLAPAVVEAVNRYTKSPSAGLLDLGFGRARAIGRGLHLFQQVSITIALRRVLGKCPYVNTVLGQLRRANFRPARFQAYGGNGRFRRWHSCSKRLNTAKRNPLQRHTRSQATDRSSDRSRARRPPHPALTMAASRRPRASAVSVRTAHTPPVSGAWASTALQTCSALDIRWRRLRARP